MWNMSNVRILATAISMLCTCMHAIPARLQLNNKASPTPIEKWVSDPPSLQLEGESCNQIHVCHGYRNGPLWDKPFQFSGVWLHILSLITIYVYTICLSRSLRAFSRIPVPSRALNYPIMHSALNFPQGRSVPLWRK